MKRKIFVICLIVALVAVAILSSTLAYFSDTDQNTNTFTIGKVGIDLYETVSHVDGVGNIKADTQTDLGKGDDTNPEYKFENILPSDVMGKTVTVENTESSPVYVALVIKQENYGGFNKYIDDVYENLDADENKAEILALGDKYVKDDKVATMQNVIDSIFTGEGWGGAGNIVYDKYSADIEKPFKDNEDKDMAIRYAMKNFNGVETDGDILGIGYVNTSVDGVTHYYGDIFEDNYNCEDVFASLPSNERAWIVYLKLDEGQSASMDIEVTCPDFITEASIGAFDGMVLDVAAYGIQTSGFTADNDGYQKAFTQLFKFGFDF